MTDNTVTPGGTIPGFQISSAKAGGAAAFQGFEQLVQDMFLIARRSDEAIERYSLDLEAWHLGTIMLGRFRSSGLSFDRTAALIAAGLDHVLVQLYTEGGFVGTADGAPVTVRADEIVLFDLTRPLRTEADDFGNITLLIPRVFFEAVVDDVSVLHGLVIPASDPLAGMLTAYMRALADRISRLTPAEAETAARATAGLATTVISALAPQATNPGRQAPAPSLFRSAVQQIERRLGDPTLDVDAIGDALGVSRATLYRVFEPVGGVAEYIRRRRLTAAALALASPEQSRRRIGELAFECGFASEATFSRAFRAEFGLSPREARQRNDGLRVKTLAHAGPADGSLFARWMRLLRG